MAKPKLLLLVHRIPYPPNKGDKIRSYQLLRHLARDYDVYLGTFVDDPADWQHVATVQTLCGGSHFAALDPRGARVRSLLALARGRALSLDYYRDAGLAAWVADVMRQQAVDRIVVFSSPMAQYAEPYRSARQVIDFCDVDSEKWRAYADNKAWPMSWLYRREARRLLAYERRIAAETCASLFVSAPEAELFRKLAPESAERIRHVSNGVDTDYFSPERSYDNPYAQGELALVFCGAMDYLPNIDAVKWFAREVLPAVRARHPQARFTIVGARPAAEVTALAADPAVTVTGTVPDVRPYVAHAAVCVAPLRIARGIQNKVLEAMAMGRSLVVTPQALEGIDAEPGRQLLTATDPAQFADQVARLLEQPDPALGAAARATVVQHYGWSSHMRRIPQLLEETLDAA
jgi:sugar transferase (PEP-CTERM/EpsH1 system associated)